MKKIYYMSLLLSLCGAGIAGISSKKYCCLLSKLKKITTIDTTILDSLTTSCDVNVIHISQADIPYTITKPGRYCVIENLFVTAGQDAITIDLDAATLGLIVIDINSYTINGLVSGFPTGRNGIIAKSVIAPSPGQALPVGIAILNGKILGMAEHGIYVPFGVSVFSVTDVTAQSDGFSSADAGGIVVGKSDQPLLNPIITNCKVLGGSGANGIVLTNPFDYLILNSTMSAIGGDGLILDNPLNIGSGVIDTCIASQNGGNGFTLTTNTDHAVFLDCIASDNGASGFNIGGPFAELNNCRAEKNTQYGFILTATSNLLTQCSTADNGIAGFNIASNSNVIFDSFAISNSGDGYLISGNFNQINGNIATSNTGTGFNRTAGTANRIYSNFANNNTGGNYSGSITNVQVNPVPADAINFTTNISD